MRFNALALHDKLQKRETHLFRQIRNGEWIRLGYGLFTTQDIPKDTVIAYFFGDLKRPQDADPYYQININANLVLDCKKHCEEGKILNYNNKYYNTTITI